jgi:hypothetical protein
LPARYQSESPDFKHMRATRLVEVDVIAIAEAEEAEAEAIEDPWAVSSGPPPPLIRNHT